MRNGIVVAAVGGLIATVVGGLIVSGVLNVTDLFWKVGSWLWDGVSWIFGLLGSSHSIPFWAILVVGSLALFGFIIIGRLLLRSLPSNSEQSHRDYTEDMLDGATWRWRWIGNRIDNLWCYCPNCDAQLVYNEGVSATRFICERCPADGSLNRTGGRGRVVATIEGGDRHYAVDATEREILRRIRTGER